MYSQSGDTKGSELTWLSDSTNIGAIWYLLVQTYEYGYHRNFRTVHQRNAVLHMGASFRSIPSHPPTLSQDNQTHPWWRNRIADADGMGGEWNFRGFRSLNNAFFWGQIRRSEHIWVFGSLMDHPNKIWQISRMPALVRTYCMKFWKFSSGLVTYNRGSSFTTTLQKVTVPSKPTQCNTLKMGLWPSIRLHWLNSWGGLFLAWLRNPPMSLWYKSRFKFHIQSFR